MPVYWFSLSFLQQINWFNAVFIFVLLHVLIYPASNGYNSYMDRDEESIGGIENPLQPTRELFRVTVAMDSIAIILSFVISLWFAAAVALYIVCSRLYSFRGIRLKRYALIGYITVVINQGALTFFMVYHGAHAQLVTSVPLAGLVAASFLIGGFYPITQVYQHESDAKDGVTTISMLLGKRGTFLFCSLMYAAALSILLFHYISLQQFSYFLVLQLFFIPVLVYFFKWVAKVWQNPAMADFKHTMQMNWLASTCTSLAFITLLILHQLG